MASLKATFIRARLSFTDQSGLEYEVLHEWLFLDTDQGEIYFVLAIFGTEYVINMGGPDLEATIAGSRANDFVHLYTQTPRSLVSGLCKWVRERWRLILSGYRSGAISLVFVAFSGTRRCLALLLHPNLDYN